MGASAKIAVAIAALAALLPASASAAYPGSNGRIAFEVDQLGQLLTMNPDGTGVQQPTNHPEFASEPAYSPDGKKILYTRGRGDQRQVWVMNSDGTGQAQVPTGFEYSFSPTWSPDGSRIAVVVAYIGSGGAPCTCHFQSVEELNLDGTGRVGLYGFFDGVERFAPTINDIEWSPRGDAIAITRQIQKGDNSHMLMVIGPSHHTFQRVLTGAPSHVQSPAWSPDGERLAFVDYNFDQGEVYTIDPDGTDRQRVTNNSAPDHSVEWSPAGDRLVVSGSERNCQDPPGPCPLQLWRMNPDGTNEVRIRQDSRHSLDPDWQPLIGAPPPAAYPRPKTASSISVSLVPAVDGCTSPNRVHGPPLAFGSCNPPVHSSPFMTTGTPDANGAAAGMTGRLRLTVLPGNPATQEDEADVRMYLNVSDVRCGPQMVQFFCQDANDTGGADTTFAKLQARLSARITDRFNLPAPGGRSSGTTNGYVPFNFEAYCIETPDRSVGSDCAGQTTWEVFYPGAVKEGLRSNLELSQVEVYDNGGDANTGQGPPEEVFLRQGLFVP